MRGNLRIGTSSFIDAHKEIPDWAAFLLWAGWWIRTNAGTQFHIRIATLLPARSCCAAISALGVCLASAQEQGDTLSFQEFMALPDNTRVSLRFQGRILQGTLGPCDRSNGRPYRRVVLDANVRKLKNAAIGIFDEDKLNQYQVSTDRRKTLSPRRLATLERVEKFYRTLDPRVRTGWCVSPRSEVLIVTSKAKWRREIEEVYGQIDDGDTELLMPVADLLVTAEQRQDSPRKTLLASPSGVVRNTAGGRIAILDGPDSIRAAEDVNADAILMLLEHSECDENTIHDIASMTNVREDDAIPKGLLDSYPAGVDMAVFGWRKQA